MNPELEDQTRHLLEQAGHAHGHYETTVLGGVYDQDWAPWYAAWAIEHGLGGLLGTSFEAQGLGQLLFEINQDHQRHGQGQSWAEYTAAELVRRFV